jgi:hypothetical protein
MRPVPGLRRAGPALTGMKTSRAEDEPGRRKAGQALTGMKTSRAEDEPGRRKAGQAMSPVRDGQCQACRLSVPPQLYNELQRADKLMVCPNCARIMYWTGHPHFREFLGEPTEEPTEIPPEKTEGRRGRKPKGKGKGKGKGKDKAAKSEADIESESELSADGELKDSPGAAL